MNTDEHREGGKGKRFGFCVSVFICVLGGLSSFSLGQTSRPTTRSVEGVSGGAVEIRTLLVRGASAKGTGTVVSVDPVAGAVVDGGFEVPSVGSVWQWMVSDEKGGFEDEKLVGGWGWAEVESDGERVMLLRARGHVMVYVNGEARAGDVYSAGFMAVPVRLHRGVNTFLFQGGRGELKARLEPVVGEFTVLGDDATLPDVVEGEAGMMLGGVVVANNTEGAIRPELKVEVLGDAGLFEGKIDERRSRMGMPSSSVQGTMAGSVSMMSGGEVVPPMSVRKVSVTFVAGNKGKAGAETWLAVGKEGEAPVKFKLRVRKETETRKVTFRSGIDGSIQYYSVVPAGDAPMAVGKRVSAGEEKTGAKGAVGESTPEPAAQGPSLTEGTGAVFEGFGTLALHREESQAGAGRPAIVLSLHGAGVEAQSQADAYAAKSWTHIVCPTNRRPYGFDWEDWGRLDALEVLGQAKETLPYDPSRVYLTGHSMGGHGTWQLAVNATNLFAAAAPSAGWVSFASYSPGKAATRPSSGPATRTAQQEILAKFRAASMASDTLGLKENLSGLGIFILHGDADDNVPVSEARSMVEVLKGFHHDWQIHEQKGAGHWWSEGIEPGARCVDYPGIFDLFARRRLQAEREVRDVKFATVNPGVASRLAWAEVRQQEKSGEMSRVSLHVDPLSRRFSGTTENVRRLVLGLSMMKWEGGGGEVAVALDGGEMKLPAEGQVLKLEKVNGVWGREAAQGYPHKTPERSGPVKLALQNRMMFVYGTVGTPGENALAYQKARYDAEVWYYRGNGSVAVVSDKDTAIDADKDCTLVLYGNGDTNAAMSRVEGGCPVSVERQKVKVEGKVYEGDYTAVYCYPRAGSMKGMVVVVGPTGERAARASMRLPVFASGIGWPDYAVISADSYKVGAAGIVGGGFFDQGWKIGP